MNTVFWVVIGGVLALSMAMGVGALAQGAPNMNAQQADGSVATGESCTQMPHGNVIERKARHNCFAAADRLLRAQKAKAVAATVYTITLYTPSGETKTWQAHDMTGMMQGLEFTDMATQHRVRIYGTFTLESSTDKVIETEEDEDANDE